MLLSFFHQLYANQLPINFTKIANEDYYWFENVIYAENQGPA